MLVYATSKRLTSCVGNGVLVGQGVSVAAAVGSAVGLLSTRVGIFDNAQAIITNDTTIQAITLLFISGSTHLSPLFSTW